MFDANDTPAERGGTERPPPSPHPAQAGTSRAESPSRLTLDYYPLIDRGLVRERNEDRCGVFVPEDARLRDERGYLFVLADGVGGYPAGDVAAELAIHTVQETYFTGPWGGPGSALRAAFSAANDAVLARARESGCTGMSAATVAAALVGTHVTVAHLGDVRAYLFRDAQAQRLTSDQSWVQERMNAGLLSAEEARVHPYRNLVTHALGADPTAAPDVLDAVVRPDDALLLCSDGLWGLAEDGEMARILAGSAGAEAAARALVDLALARGGHDNISVIVVRAVASTSVSSTVMLPRRPRA
jgi:serine/threonine protein phosphatase PrpC